MTTIHDVVRYHITEAKRCREHIERNGDRCPRAAYEEIATFHDECAAVLHDHLAKGAQVPDAMNPFESQPEGLNYSDGWNACRQAMLSQRGES